MTSRYLFRYASEFFPYLIERANGASIYTTDGKEILDFTSGQMCATLGHSHPEIVAAIRKAAAKNIHLFSMMLSPSVVSLAEELAAMVPESLSKIMFLSTGSESNEAALRMAKLHTKKFEVVALTNSWHGMTAGVWSSTYAAGHQNYGPAMPGTMALPAPNCYRCLLRLKPDSCEFACIDVGFSTIDAQSVGSLAAVIVEPILSSGGIIVPPLDYFKKLQIECRRREALLIFDEAQTAFGRLGKNFAYEIFDVVPDFLTVSKTLGGGIPLAAVLTSEVIEADCVEKGFLYYTSHVSDPLPAEVGLAVIRVLAAEKLGERAREMGTYLKNGLEKLQARHECIGDVRGKGLLLGMEFVLDRETRIPAPQIGAAVTRRCLDLGLHVNIVDVAELASVVRIAPPLTVRKSEIDTALAILDTALTATMSSHRRNSPE